eukprot:GEMP01063007.1.p1 GENE.GEMP01063007.1~~GEMP01063007.1.p1  ORF type:complete len:284 (+),score=33.97 GEMP01063007.1:50-853(+)
MRPSRAFAAMSHASYQLRGNVAVITLLGKEGVMPWGTKIEEHRISPKVLEEINPLLDRVQNEAQSLVLTGEGKFFCNGLDLAFADGNPDQLEQFVTDVNAFLARLLTFPLPTCGALNGHTCALGSMIALALDYRLMGNKGIFFIPGVELGLRYTPGMLAMMKAKTSTQLHRDMIIYGKRFRPDDLLRAKIVDEIVWPGSVLDRSVEFVKALGDRGTPDDVEFIKKAVYEDAYQKLTNPALMDMKLRDRRSFGTSEAKAFAQAQESKL